MTESLLVPDAGGLYCRAGDFWIDPLRTVPRSIITHAHADHARAGAAEVFTARAGLPVLTHRIGQPEDLVGLDYGQPIELGETRITLFPAGHILGSATVRIESAQGTWGVSGDFKRTPDPTCEAFQPFDCDVWLSECTFGLPVYRWPETDQVIAEMLDWWQACRAQGRPAVLFCYALGKAQRVMAELHGAGVDEPIWLHGAMRPLTDCYREQGIALPPTRLISEADPQEDFRGQLILAPPSAAGSSWMRRFKGHSAGFVSGWMRIRGNRRRRGYDRGFVLSDHADWPGLVGTAADMNAGRVITIHGNGEALTRHLASQGLEAESWNLRATLAPDRSP
ncbi:ligase-associated DNA damage response exonuclease [Wenzhouxiangella marina]|uniref:mRNA 3-end processing factor n=1 Tax=Wenzhouxiangella marina TaxID=1579979 RepID=A0A0K0XUK0_9GAMM|nr:ligase-associated DNA damage response exonuclease [Wenzhouxiangella marina]AKS41389.1 mRNA 3-end processing factor [Wenzhouxiangella marina]MBB6086857.1 putative mRNA 3-end processing factor [Wenzhouxiangella marina]